MPFRVANFVEDKSMHASGLISRQNSANLLYDTPTSALPVVVDLAKCVKDCLEDKSSPDGRQLDAKVHNALISDHMIEPNSGELYPSLVDNFCQSIINKATSILEEEAASNKSELVSSNLTKDYVEVSDAKLEQMTWVSNGGPVQPMLDVYAVAEDIDVDDAHGVNPGSSLMQAKISRTISSVPVVPVEPVPLWGVTSIRGGRPEMEDAFTALPRFHRFPTKMLTGDSILDDTSLNMSQTADFYGVYDGHGGCQVANYCRNRLHLALMEEIDSMIEESLPGVNENDLLMQWEKLFTQCFLKVDAEVGGARSNDTDGMEDNLEPIAPETVGSTAVAAVITRTNIIVANTGDSRAVLCRGKAALALSVDQKPDRKDERDRIEAADGKVIQWNGYRVFGILAMSRSIGDRHLKPWIIPDPEVIVLPRTKEDDCLILASDGLWDVMTNEEACEAARRRILLWHKKHGSGGLANSTPTTTTSSPTHLRGQEVDPAAQAAADYLCKLALQKGSKDNITVVVVDLKPHRKVRSKT